MKDLGLPSAVLAAFCEKHHIARLALFGSVLKGQARETSALDLLVAFDPWA